MEGSPDAFGRRALAAIQAKDPEQLCELFVKHEDIQWSFDRCRNAIDDPLKKARFEEEAKVPDEEKMTRWNDKWRRNVMGFLYFIENGDAVLTFEQLKTATYLGLVGEVYRRTFDEETGVSLEDIGVIKIKKPTIFIGVQGRVFEIRLNEALAYGNGHWRVSGDLGPSFLGLSFGRRLDLDVVKFEMVSPGAREVLERVNRYLPDRPVLPQDQEKGVVAKIRPNAARIQLKIFATQLRHYELDVGTFPATELGLRGLRQPPSDTVAQSRWAGPYARSEIPPDPWGNPYQYMLELSDPTNGRGGFKIWSNGPSGQSNGDPPDGDDVSVYSYERPVNPSPVGPDPPALP